MDHYIYDPANPAPTTGGARVATPCTCRPGRGISAAVEAREDVLIYSTGALSQDMEATGPVSVELYAKSSAADTDFTAKLVDVSPNGFAQNLTEGIVRARYRNSREKAALLNPGEVYNSRSIFGQQATCSRKVTSCGSKLAAAIFRDSTGI